MIIASIIIFYICFAFIASQRYIFSLSIFLFLLPTYLIRFYILGIPTTLLEGMFYILFLLWLSGNTKQNIDFKKIKTKIKSIYTKNKPLFWGGGIFALSATINIFTSVDIRSALGVWKAFYIEPLLFALIIATIIENKKQLHTILYGLVFSGLATGILVLYQHFTGWMVPWDFWENMQTYRATGWWGFPNGVGFYLSLIFPFGIYLFIAKDENIFNTTIKHILNGLKGINGIKNIIIDFFKSGILRTSALLTSLIAIPGILFAKNTGALIGVLASVGVLALVYKKTKILAIIALIISITVLIFIPAENSFKKELLFQDKSGQTRIAMWKEAMQMLRDRPIMGAGLASYKIRIIPYHTTVNKEGIEIFHHPHHQFLTLWSEIGIIGALTFVWLTIWTILELIHKPNKLKFTILFVFTTFLVIGMVDSPYIKNDTSIIFWLLPALLILEKDL